MNIDPAVLTIVLYLNFAFLALMLLMAGIIMILTKTSNDREVIKLRFAYVTFTGIMIVFIFTAILYFCDSRGIGEKIFDRAVTAMTPLAGVILGYIFGGRKPQTTDGSASK
ncbi:hypothetical protein ACFSM5_09525 [Lacibacterium aquatile]|uniref:Uncharacterized protein n=1 Tax=Lacibacterium aquatile TaxID=1168082 RepID=A0ABW5DV47_9PROT